MMMPKARPTCNSTNPIKLSVKKRRVVPARPSVGYASMKAAHNKAGRSKLRAVSLTGWLWPRAHPEPTAIVMWPKTRAVWNVVAMPFKSVRLNASTFSNTPGNVTQVKTAIQTSERASKYSANPTLPPKTHVRFARALNQTCSRRCLDKNAENRGTSVSSFRTS
jgi:hypothetical protein